jgi:hypothetical protein
MRRPTLGSPQGIVIDAVRLFAWYKFCCQVGSRPATLPAPERSINIAATLPDDKDVFLPTCFVGGCAGDGNAKSEWRMDRYSIIF